MHNRYSLEHPADLSQVNGHPTKEEQMLSTPTTTCKIKHTIECNSPLNANAHAPLLHAIK